MLSACFWICPVDGLVLTAGSKGTLTYPHASTAVYAVKVSGTVRGGVPSQMGREGREGLQEEGEAARGRLQQQGKQQAVLVQLHQ